HMLAPPPRPPPFPYTTLFRSLIARERYWKTCDYRCRPCQHVPDSVTRQPLARPLPSATAPLQAVTDALSPARDVVWRLPAALEKDRKSTRLNSSHQIISYAVF